MPGNTFKAAIRNIRKGKVFSFINIFGLALGLSACILIALFVTDEFNYDRYNEKADRIFRIVYDARSSLTDPYSVVISERIAEKYFNSTEILGQTLFIQNNSDTATYKITGVIKDIPAASHFHFDIIRSMAEKPARLSQMWVNPNCATYILAKPGVTNKEIDQILNSAVAKYVAPQLAQQTNSNLEEMKLHGDYFREYSIPLSRIHLYSNVLGEFETNGSIRTVRISMLIAILILLIACVNFMNLSTARSADRAREVGVKKVLGASRHDLVAGFLSEATLTSTIALLLAILITAVSLPFFDQLSGKDFHIGVLGQKWLLVALLPTPIVLGILAGSYPALYLSSFKPITVLRGRLVLGFKSSWFRNSLVVFQFAIAIALVVIYPTGYMMVLSPTGRTHRRKATKHFCCRDGSSTLNIFLFLA